MNYFGRDPQQVGGRAFTECMALSPIPHAIEFLVLKVLRVDKFLVFCSLFCVLSENSLCSLRLKSNDS